MVNDDVNIPKRVTVFKITNDFSFNLFVLYTTSNYCFKIIDFLFKIFIMVEEILVVTILRNILIMVLVLVHIDERILCYFVFLKVSFFLINLYLHIFLNVQDFVDCCDNVLQVNMVVNVILMVLFHNVVKMNHLNTMFPKLVQV